MAESNYESKTDEIERENLQKTISEVELVLARAKPGSQAILQTFLLNARGRVGNLDKKIKDSEKERESHTRDQVVLAQLAESEKALNAEEKKTFSGFMEKAFFTKNDFENLDKFYSTSWERLSQPGKNEMSQRIWEGVRRDEYKFSELPNAVREKESKQAYSRLKDSEIGDVNSARIPENDKHDFIRAYESGDRKEASKVLDRASFRENMFHGRESAAREHSKAGEKRIDEKANVANRTRVVSADANEARVPESANKAGLDLGDINLDGVKLSEVKGAGSSADIPNAKAADAVTRQSTRGC